MVLEMHRPYYWIYMNKKNEIHFLWNLEHKRTFTTKNTGIVKLLSLVYLYHTTEWIYET